MAEWVILKFIAKHNHPAFSDSIQISITSMHSTVQKLNAAHRLVRSFGNEGIGLSNIVRVCNAAGWWTNQDIIARQGVILIEVRGETKWEDNVNA